MYCSVGLKNTKRFTLNKRWDRFVSIPSSWLWALGFGIGMSGFSTSWSGELEPISDFRTAFTELPAIDMPYISQSKNNSVRDIGSAEAVSVRFARDNDGRAWLVIGNDYPWSESFEIHWYGLAPEVVRCLEDSPAIAVEGASAKDVPKTKSMSSRWRCDLPPHTHGGWELRASEASIVQWTHRAEPAAKVMLESELAELSQSLTQLTQFRPLADTPHQGGFETDNATAIPTDWLVSLNPSVSWQVNHDVARNGMQSIDFRSPQANSAGWIQSPAFPLPDGKRMAAEAWIRFDPAFARPKIVATTTLLRSDGNRQEWKHSYPQNHVYGKNLEWHRIDFPTLNSDSLGKAVDSHCRVRLALDIEGPAHLWIDDVSASRVFLDEEERRKLRSQLFVAQRELTQNRLDVAWQLTQSEVSQYVLANASAEGSSFEMPRTESFADRPTVDAIVPTRKAERPLFRRKLR